MTERGIARIKRAAERAERRAWKSVNAGMRYRNRVGAGAVRSGRTADKYFTKARRLLASIQLRVEGVAAEKRKRLSTATSEFNKVAPWNKKKRKSA